MSSIRKTEQIDCCKVVQPVSKGDHALPGALDVGCRGLMNLYLSVFGMYFLLKKTKGTVKDARRSRNNNFQKKLQRLFRISEKKKSDLCNVSTFFTDSYFRCSTLLDRDGMFYSGLGKSV